MMSAPRVSGVLLLVLGLSDVTSALRGSSRVGCRAAMRRRCISPLLSAAEEAEGATEREVDVEQAAEEVKELLAEEEAMGAKLEAVVSPSNYLDERDALVGTLTSSELLDRDEAAGFWPGNLEPGESTVEQMAFVDEMSCTGCAWCPHVARSTFSMDETHGKARVYQQGEDLWDTIDEAMDVCPAGCIHFVSRNELRVLEEHRDMHLESLQAEASRYGHGHGHWRDPLESDGWRRTDNCRKATRD